MFSLKPHKSNALPFVEPRASIRFGSKELKVNMECSFPEEGHPYCSENFSSSFKNWGLWEFDVFEIFLTREEKRLPYLELQISPLDQKFALLVKKPRVEADYPQYLPFQTKTILDANCWKSAFTVPLKNIPGEGKTVYGNLHAIIGEKRAHYSLRLNHEETPDFHRPELFAKLGEIS